MKFDDSHARPVVDVATTFATDLRTGLSTSAVESLRSTHGANALPEARSRSLASVFFAQLASPLIYLLLAAGAIALVLGHRTDAAVIGFVVIVNAVIGAFQEGRAARSLRALRKLTNANARVLRDGHQSMIATRDLVPGDVLLVEAGDAVGADARLIEEANLQLAEATLTGESLPVAKHTEPVALDAALGDRANMLFTSTHVTGGRGRAIVVATGVATEIGRIAALAEQTKHTKTPLERRVAQFGRYVIVASLAIFALVVVLGVAHGMPIGDVVMVGISQLVGMIPEGLPVAMTIALSIGVQRMARRRAVVRQLAAVETLGSTTVICTDKTGTLTRNELTVTTISLPDGRELAVTGSGYQPVGTIEATDDAVRQLLEACVLCNDARLESSAADEWTPVGDPTEVALLVLALKGGVQPDEVRRRLQRKGERPFDPSTKYMATEHHGDAGSFVVIKGAPEVVVELAACRERTG